MNFVLYTRVKDKNKQTVAPLILSRAEHQNDPRLIQRPVHRFDSTGCADYVAAHMAVGEERKTATVSLEVQYNHVTTAASAQISALYFDYKLNWGVLFGLV